MNCNFVWFFFPWTKVMVSIFYQWSELVLALECNCPPFSIEIMHWFGGKPEQKLKLETSESFISASMTFERFFLGWQNSRGHKRRTFVDKMGEFSWITEKETLDRERPNVLKFCTFYSASFLFLLAGKFKLI